MTVLAIFNDMGVDDRLYALVFGESMLNDVVAIVLYRSISEYKPELNNELSVGSFFYSIWVFLVSYSLRPDLRQMSSCPLGRRLRHGVLSLRTL